MIILKESTKACGEFLGTFWQEFESRMPRMVTVQTVVRTCYEVYDIGEFVQDKMDYSFGDPGDESEFDQDRARKKWGWTKHIANSEVITFDPRKIAKIDENNVHPVIDLKRRIFSVPYLKDLRGLWSGIVFYDPRKVMCWMAPPKELQQEYVGIGDLDYAGEVSPMNIANFSQDVVYHPGKNFRQSLIFNFMHGGELGGGIKPCRIDLTVGFAE